MTKNIVISLLMLTLFVLLVAYLFSQHAVLWLNVLFGGVVVTLGMGLVVAGAMANDSGKGGRFVEIFQFLTLSYPLTYLAGLIGSVIVMNSDMDNRHEIASWMSVANGFQLLLIALVLVLGIWREERARN